MPIPLGSPFHKCFHEAGHVEVALHFGARVTRAGLGSDGEAVTSVLHREDLSTKIPVACGGYAAERLLYECARLVDQFGRPLSEAAFEHQAMQNARLDKYPFYLHTPADESGRYPGAAFQPKVGAIWPPESNQPFVEYAELHILPLLRPRLALMDALAHEMKACGVIGEEEIARIRMDFS
jgi:hypothetical protein